MQKYCNIWTPYLFIIPAGIVLILFFFIPFFETFLLSFKSFDKDIYNAAWVGVENYRKLFNLPEFWKVLKNTFVYLICAVPLLVTLPLIIAIALSQKIRGINFYKVIIYIPVIVSIVVAGIAWKWLYAGDGVLNYLISLFGVDKIGWLTDPDYALYSVIAVTVWKGLGYYMLVYVAALTTVPQELYEAAEIDGATTFRKHLTVTIPHLMPTIALVSIISSISAMKVFVEIFVMTQGGPLNSSKTIVYYIYQNAFEYLNLGIASAAGVVLLVVVLILSIINMKFFDEKKYSI